MFTTDDISKVLQYYPGSNATDSTNAVEYATLGYTGATANNESSISTGQQQRANVRAKRAPIFPLKLTSQTLTTETEYLRRNNIRMPFLLARGSLRE